MIRSPPGSAPGTVRAGLLFYRLTWTAQLSAADSCEVHVDNQHDSTDNQLLILFARVLIYTDELQVKLSSYF